MVTQTPDGKILFEFCRPGAREVFIAGDFNGWRASFRMTPGEFGWWSAQIELAPGTYRFRYKADGDWFTDYAAFGIESGPFGWNSVLKVDAAETRSPVTAPAAPVVVEKPVAVERPAPRVAPAPIRFVPASVALASAEPERRVRRRPAMAN